MYNNFNQTTQNFGAPVNNFNATTPVQQPQGNYQSSNTQGQRQPSRYKTPCSIQQRVREIPTMPEALHATFMAPIYHAKIEDYTGRDGKIYKRFQCSICVKNQTSLFNQRFSPKNPNNELMPIFNVTPDNDVLWVQATIWDNERSKSVERFLLNRDISDGTMFFIGGMLKCTTSNKPEHAGRYFLNLTGYEISVVPRSPKNNTQQNGEQINYQNNNNYGGQVQPQPQMGQPMTQPVQPAYGEQPMMPPVQPTFGESVPYVTDEDLPF